MNTFEGKNILVTGASGLIGSNLVDRLMTLGPAKVIVTGRNMKKLETTFSAYIERDNFQIVQHDAATVLPKTVRDIDFIFHAAGPMEREIVLNRPVDVVLPNLLGTINALELLKHQAEETGRRGRIIIFSSVTVYDSHGIDDYDAIETETTFASSLDAPTACYSESKRMSEVIARSYAKQYGTDAVIVRFSTVYGPTKNIPETAFYEFIKKAMAGEDIIVNSSAAPRRDNIYVDDAIEGLLCVALKGISGEAYNVSSGGDLGNYAAIDEIARDIVKISNKGSKVICKNVGIKRGGLTLNNMKLKTLGWELKTSQIDGILKTIEELK